MFRWTRNKTSLTSRIIVLSSIGITFLLFISGSAIIWAFNQSVERSLNNNLSAYMDVLIAATSLNSNGLPVVHSDMHLLDGLPRYWQITAEKRHIIKSPLLVDWLPVIETEGNALQRISYTDSEGTDITAVQQSIIFPGNQKVTYIFGVQSDIAKAFLTQEQERFYAILFVLLGAISVFFIIFTYLQIRLSIAPLADIKHALRRIQSGESNKLGEEFPKEIQPLATEVNNMLAYSSGIIERYRNFSSNLAHALKTPLSVLRNEAQKENSPLSDTVKEKGDVMLSLIERNLARVRAAGSGNVLGARTEAYSTINKITKSFGKLYHKNVSIEGAQTAYFRGDEGDLYEMLGNVIENACKHAKSQIHVTITQDTMLHIIIADDGKGIPESERKNVLKRGKRLDETMPGSGIGLSITQDILALYQGTMELGSSSLGGLEVKVSLPLAD